MPRGRAASGEGRRGEDRHVARLAIARDFLAEYAQLDKDAQHAVDGVIARFAQAPDTPPRLDRLPHSRDHRIRTIEVDGSWRGIVLAPDAGDTYCLVTVLPSDLADAYAASRRFSVNQALGVLEVRDEATIQQLRPELEAVAS